MDPVIERVFCLTESLFKLRIALFLIHLVYIHTIKTCIHVNIKKKLDNSYC